MHAWIPLLVTALLFTGLHKFSKYFNKESRDLELTKTKAVITATSQESNRKYIYVRFQVNEKTYEQQVRGNYPLSSHYCKGQEIPIGYYLRNNGAVTVFIDDQDLDRIKNPPDTNFFIYIAIGLYIAAAAFFAYFLMHL